MRRRLLCAAVLACGCAGQGAYLISPALRAAPDTRVAVLPFENRSAEPGAAAAMRALAAEGFGLRGYPPLPLEEVDGALGGAGLPAGAPPAAEAGRALKAGLLCYGTVEDFSLENLGQAVRKAVRLRLKIVSASTGETLFEGEGAGGDFRAFPGQAEARDYFMEQSALGGGAAPGPALKREARAAAAAVLDRLPRR